MTAFYDWIRETLMNLAFEGTLPLAFQFGFVINALLCALLIDRCSAASGTMVVTKRMAFFSQAVGNAAMTGVAIGVLLGESYTEPYISTFSFCILFGLVLNYTKGPNGPVRRHADRRVSVDLAGVGASLLLFVSARVNTHILEAVLFGSVLTVSDTDINVLLVVTVATLLIGIPLFNRLLLASLNPSLADVRGVPVRALEYVFVLMITVLTVACSRSSAAVLVEALLLIPAAAARNVIRSMKGFVFLSMAISTVQLHRRSAAADAARPATALGRRHHHDCGRLFVVTLLIRITIPRFREA